MRKASQSGPTPRLASRVALAGLSLLLTVVALEAGLRLIARLWPSPLLVLASGDVEELVRRKTRAPGQLHLGFRSNSLGYNDEAFGPRRPDRVRVVSIADSFAWGGAPHHFHFTTVAERHLPETEVLNVGWSATGVDVYLYLLETVARPLRPDLIVINLFIGNDVAGLQERFEPGLEGWLRTDRWLAIQVPRRGWRLTLERLRKRREPQSGDGLPGQYSLGRSREVAPAELSEVFPWLDDPLVEPPTFSKESFLEIEARRARTLGRIFDPKTPERLQEFLARLELLRRAAGEIPLLFTLIPDEYQVEDALWEEVSARLDHPVDRFAPQSVLGAWFERKDQPYLDLLEPLREARPLADGRRHVYFARDTHLNRRGNEIVGRSLAAAIAELPGLTDRGRGR